MERKVTVRRITGKQLIGTARHHTVVTDRTPEEQGTDIGCTSGELLLLAIGSCSMGGMRRYFEERGEACERLSADVFFEAQQSGRDRIVISVHVDPACTELDEKALTAAATGGGVVSRLKLGSDVHVRIS